MLKMVTNVADISVGNMPSDIFTGVAFTIVTSAELNEATATQLTRQLVRHGATQCSPSFENLKTLTHIIAASIDFPAYNDAIDAYINVVKPIWVERAILKQNMPNSRQYSPDPCLYLSDVVVSCSEDIPQGDKDAILGGVNAAGGQYSPALTKLVTHVVTLTMNNPKCQALTQRGLRCIPVLPHWFNDCLKLGKKIDAKPYILPHAQILNRHLNSPVGWKVSEDVDGASNATPMVAALPMTPSKSRKVFNVLRNKTIYLDDDLELGTEMKKTIESILKEGGAMVVNDIRRAKILICRYRCGESYKIAARAGFDVGSLSWLYYLITRNAYMSPTRRLLHYPVPINGIDGFQNAVISVSNYTGDARIYLENLIRAAGGKFTKTMTEGNTHLITAHKVSKKCEAAKDWGIHIVNHLWLEESYAKCKMQSLTNTRYTHFPHRTNLGEVLGKTQLDRDAVERFYFAVPPGSPVISGQLENISLNSVYRDAIGLTGSSPPHDISPSSTEKENNSVVARGRRAAKERAAEKLRDQVSDIALFEKESKRVGGVIYGGRKVSDADRIMVNSGKLGRKRHSDGTSATTSNKSSIDGHSDNDDENDQLPARKKQKAAKTVRTENTTGTPLKVLVTGYDRWITPAHQTKDRAKLKALGIAITDKVGSHTVLVAPKMLRTVKFVAGIVNACSAVHVDWLEACIKKGKVVPDQHYLLTDPSWEKANATSMVEIMERAKLHRETTGMLKGWTVFCTEGASGETEPWAKIIAANKGRLIVWNGNEIELRESKHYVARRGQSIRELFLVTEECDKALWAGFNSMAISQGWQPRIVSRDWLVTIATCQDIDRWDDAWLLAA